MRTIPRNYPGKRTNGDYRADCDYCGGTYYRSRMHRDPAGRLVCPERGCADGRDALTLDRLNAAGAVSASPPRRRGPSW